MSQRPLIQKIISGGQTGADRAALDAAIEIGRSYGGWLPKGRLTEEGPLPESYILQEMESGAYPERTKKNVLEGEGTLIVSHGPLTGGSLLTRKFAEQFHRPHLHIDCKKESHQEAVARIEQWLRYNSITVLNVAGPRASGDPAIYAAVKSLVVSLLALESD